MILDATSSAIQQAAEQLAMGHLVAIPTETVYGLAGDAANGEAVAAIYATKGRPAFNPLIVHVASIEQAHEVAHFSPLAEEIAAKFWPGPLTLILPKRQSADIASLVTAGLETIAVRMPTHPIARAVLGALERPFVAPSANRSGQVSPTKAEHVEQEFGGTIPILDAGPCTEGLESTILDVASGSPRILRPGPITKEALEAFTKASIETVQGGDVIAPGMLSSHYAPSAHLRTDVMTPDPDEGFLGFGDCPDAVINLSPRGDLIEAAANLFDYLRELDRQFSRIAVAPVPHQGVGIAINDRLARAAAPKPSS